MESSVAKTHALQETKVISGFVVNFTELCQLERNYLEISNLHFLVHQAFSTYPGFGWDRVNFLPSSWYSVFWI